MEECDVIKNVETVRADGSQYHAVQIGCTNVSEKKVTRSMAGHFLKASAKPKALVKEFPVTPDAHIAVGMQLFLYCTRNHL